ncbi:hypothetical protein, partial [Pseudomonas brassicacearum]|uniref:hypothetical protein n=1 Tax=Pseudomonas brassicacearum TaxID=930166 RepID=UPI003465D3AC
GSERCVGAVECNEAAIFPLPMESEGKDQGQGQKIAGFASSYRAQRGGATIGVTLKLLGKYGETSPRLVGE